MTFFFKNNNSLQRQEKRKITEESPFFPVQYCLLKQTPQDLHYCHLMPRVKKKIKTNLHRIAKLLERFTKICI